MSSKPPQCARCGHLAQPGDEEAFLETPCEHLYCSKCVHRYVSVSFGGILDIFQVIFPSIENFVCHLRQAGLSSRVDDVLIVERRSVFSRMLYILCVVDGLC